MSTEVFKRLEAIRSSVQSFQIEQEKEYLKNKEENFNIISFLSSPTPLPSSSSSSTLPTDSNSSPTSPSPEAISDSLSKLNSILNQNILILPLIKTNSLTKLWPQALTINYETLQPEFNSIESTGTLFRIIQREDSYPGIRGYLVSNEYNKQKKYLNKNLQFVDIKSEAALWNILYDAKSEVLLSKFSIQGKIDEKIRKLENNSSNSPTTTRDSSRGIPIILELIEDETSFPNCAVLHPDGDCLMVKNPSVLSCTFNRLTSSSKLKLLTIDQVLSNSSTSTTTTSLQENSSDVIISSWEICPENWISEELDFLESYLN